MRRGGNYAAPCVLQLYEMHLIIYVNLYVQPEKPRNLLLQISIRGFIPIATISVAFVERCHHLSVFYDTDEFVES